MQKRLMIKSLMIFIFKEKDTTHAALAVIYKRQLHIMQRQDLLPTTWAWMYAKRYMLWLFVHGLCIQISDGGTIA